MGVLVEDLLESAKFRSFAPTSQSTYEDADLITIANEEMIRLVHDIFIKREDYFLTSKDVALTGSVDRVGIPKQSIGNTFKSLWYTENSIVQSRLLPATEDDYIVFSGQTGTPQKFLIEGDEVVLLPTPANSTGYARFRYYAKPNLLAATADCTKITAISSAGGTTTFTVDTDLSSDLAISSQVDLLSAKSPYMLWASEVAITAISSTQIEVATTDVDNAAGTVEPQVGDYICPTGYANIPMLPYEFHPVLAQMIACRQLHGLGDLNKLGAAEAELAKLRGEATNLIENRIETAPRVLTPYSRGLVRTFSGR